MTSRPCILKVLTNGFGHVSSKFLVDCYMRALTSQWTSTEGSRESSKIFVAEMNRVNSCLGLYFVLFPAHSIKQMTHRIISCISVIGSTRLPLETVYTHSLRSWVKLFPKVNSCFQFALMHEIPCVICILFYVTIHSPNCH